eukprot:1999834-Lingulodinium_polyedra.AAC.1
MPCSSPPTAQAQHAVEFLREPQHFLPRARRVLRGVLRNRHWPGRRRRLRLRPPPSSAMPCHARMVPSPAAS